MVVRNQHINWLLLVVTYALTLFLIYITAIPLSTCDSNEKTTTNEVGILDGRVESEEIYPTKQETETKNTPTDEKPLRLISVSGMEPVSAEVSRLTGIPEGNHARVTRSGSDILAVQYYGSLYRFDTVNGKLMGKDISGSSQLEKDIYQGNDLEVSKGTMVLGTWEFTNERREDGFVKCGNIIAVEYKGKTYHVKDTGDKYVVIK